VPRSYVSIPGSAQLPTRARAATATTVLTSTATTRLRSTDVAGHELTRVVIRGSVTAVSNRVFDELALEQSALEQVVYLHLYRLAIGLERNFCSVSRVELAKRTCLTDRRLGKALAGLVGKGHIAMVERTRDGTVYVVRLPEDVVDAPPSTAPTREPISTSPAAMAVPNSIGDAVRCAQEAYPQRRWSGASLTEAVLALLEEGVPFVGMPGAFAHFHAVAPVQTPVTSIVRHLTPAS
jgi:hypothetical protein